jgi:hypothetical protein
VTDFSAYVGSLPKHLRLNTPANYAASFSPNPQNVDFDLGATYAVSKLAFWNYPFPQSGGVTSLDVFTANDLSFSSPFFAGTFFPADDGNETVNTVQVFDLTDSNAKYVRLRVTQTAEPGGFGFSEVAFGVVPEPLTTTNFAIAAAMLVGSTRMARLRQRVICTASLIVPM